MLIIPAIDLKDGHCVRLQQGRMDSATVFSDDPAKAAAQWAAKGARRLHVVDLNGAVAGKPRNESAVKAILAALDSDVPVQLGGGIRDLDTIERYLDQGVSYVIIGTAAVKTPGFLRDACTAFGGHVLVALDANRRRHRQVLGPLDQLEQLAEEVVGGHRRKPGLDGLGGGGVGSAAGIAAVGKLCRSGLGVPGDGCQRGGDG